MKVCFKCNLAKPLEEFYTNRGMADGHLNKCKDCAKLDMKQYAYLKKTTDLEWTMKERERCRIKTLNYRLRGLHKPSPEGSRKWIKANRHKRNAQQQAYRAFKAGKIAKPELCMACGERPAREMHHPDYTRPLVVLWLCTSCHGKTRRLTTL